MNQGQKPAAGNSTGTASRRNVSAPWYGIPWDIAGRIGLLFTALCLIKLAMLFGFRKHLYEVHWRVGTAPEGWLNPVVFYGFALLTGLNLWQLGKKCAQQNARAVRFANACILILGAIFIFLTFHAGDNNYLYPVMEGSLKWQNLSSYLSLNFFFQPPFLAGWVFVYVLIYYGLARAGREHLVLYVTAVFAAIYLALFLTDLEDYRNVLLVVDCLGVAGLLAGIFSQQSLRWFYLLLLCGWPVFFYLVLREGGSSLKNTNPENSLLTGWCLVLFGGITALAWHRKIHPAWTWLLPFAFVTFLLLTNINYPGADNYQNLFCLGLTLPRYFLGEFFLALALLCVAKWYRHWLPKASLLWLDGLSLLLIILALADLRLSQIMGVRLDWQAVKFGADLKMVWREARPFLPAMAVGLIIITALYAILIGLWQRGPVEKTLQPGGGGKFLLFAFLLLGGVGSWTADTDKAESESALLLAGTSPLFQGSSFPVMDRKTFMDAARQLGMEQMLARPAGTPSRPRRPLNVVLIFQESTYNKYLSMFSGREETQPLLSKYKDRMEVFPNFFSSFAGSINARFAALTGLYPVSDYTAFTTEHVPVKSLFDILHGAGYECSVFYSSYLDYTGFRDFLNGRGIVAMYDADTMPGRKTEPSVTWGLPEDETIRAIQSQIGQYATNHQSFFLTYVPVAPHNPFDGIPDQFRKYHLKEQGDYTPLYLDDLLYMDSCITTILDELKTTGLLENTLVIITDDHGEMLGENGGPIGHGWMATPELTNIPLIIMDPGNPGYHVNDVVGSQVDLLPTVLELLGLPLPPDQLYQGASLYSPAAQTGRKIYLNSFQQYGIVEGRRYLLGSRETGAAVSTNDLSFFDITNSGAHTAFPQIPATNASSPSISEFDKFQANLLKNYSQYSEMIRK